MTEFTPLQHAKSLKSVNDEFRFGYTAFVPDRITANSPLVLIIRDGWGENPNREHDSFNAIKLAGTPIADQLMNEWPTTLIKTSGEDVGVSAGTMGNSEVGHQNIGAGRVVDQEIMRITRAIRDESFFENKAILEAFHQANRHSGSVHYIGLVSDGKVHSAIQHLFALIDLAVRLKFPGDRLFIHAITDGRDTGPKTGLGFIKQLEDKLASTQAGRIATVMGRYYAMDRDYRWDRIENAYRCLTGDHALHESTAIDAIERYYHDPTNSSQEGDEFIVPTRIVETRIKHGDAVIFFNFRGDRPRQLTKAFVLDDDGWSNVANGGFDRGKRIDNLYFCTMTGYEEGLPVSAIAFQKPPSMKNILGEVVSNLGRTQFRCAETEKYAHVTFFFNDYREEPFRGETRELIQSPKDVKTYDQKPEMSAPGVCDAVLKRLNTEDCESLIVVNFANGDMVGHTGKLNAAIKAIEAVDHCVGKIVNATLARNGSLIITADHGNAEQMWNPEHDCPHTAHTTYEVPLIIVGHEFKSARLRSGSRLADIAPTVLAMMKLDQPKEMTGQSLIQT